MKDDIEGWDNSYERVGRKRGTVYYALELYTDDNESVADIVPLDVSSRADLGKEAIREALTKWAITHEETVSSWRVTECMTCAIGGVNEPPAIVPGDAEEENDAPYPGPHPAYQDDTFDDLDIDIDQGETVAYRPGGNQSVYGTQTGTVIGVGPGPRGNQCLIIRSDSEEKRIRLEWIACDQS